MKRFSCKCTWVPIAHMRQFGVVTLSLSEKCASSFCTRICIISHSREKTQFEKFWQVLKSVVLALAQFTFIRISFENDPKRSPHTCIRISARSRNIARAPHLPCGDNVVCVSAPCLVLFTIWTDDLGFRLFKRSSNEGFL